MSAWEKDIEEKVDLHDKLLNNYKDNIGHNKKEISELDEKIGKTELVEKVYNGIINGELFRAIPVIQELEKKLNEEIKSRSNWEKAYVKADKNIAELKTEILTLKKLEIHDAGNITKLKEKIDMGIAYDVTNIGNVLRTMFTKFEHEHDEGINRCFFSGLLAALDYYKEDFYEVMSSKPECINKDIDDYFRQIPNDLPRIKYDRLLDIINRELPKCDTCDYKLFANVEGLSEEKMKSIMKKYKDGENEKGLVGTGRLQHPKIVKCNIPTPPFSGDDSIPSKDDVLNGLPVAIDLDELLTKEPPLTKYIQKDIKDFKMDEPITLVDPKFPVPSDICQKVEYCTDIPCKECDIYKKFKEPKETPSNICDVYNCNKISTHKIYLPDKLEPISVCKKHHRKYCEEVTKPKESSEELHYRTTETGKKLLELTRVKEFLDKVKEHPDLEWKMDLEEIFQDLFNAKMKYSLIIKISSFKEKYGFK